MDSIQLDTTWIVLSLLAIVIVAWLLIRAFQKSEKARKTPNWRKDRGRIFSKLNEGSEDPTRSSSPSQVNPQANPTPPPQYPGDISTAIPPAAPAPANEQSNQSRHWEKPAVGSSSSDSENNSTSSSGSSFGMGGKYDIGGQVLSSYERSISAALQELNCTVFSPVDVQRGSTFLIQVFAHIVLDDSSLAAMAERADKASKLRTAESFGLVAVGSQLMLTLILGDIPIEEPTITAIWSGKLKQLQFDATIPEDYKKPDVIGKILVSVNSVPIGQLKFKISIVNPTETNLGSELSENIMRRFEQAFISYASADREEVLKRVQVLELMRLQYFQDLLTLRPGDVWDEKIYEYLDRSDVVFLFWSKAASESEWVIKEILYAVKIKNDNNEALPEIIPVIIEGPPPAKAPEALSFLHFNDKMIYFINQEAEIRAQKGLT